MERSLAGGQAAFAAASTLILACLCVLPAGARQQGSSTSTAAKKSSTAKTAATSTAKPAGKKTSTHKTHSAAKSSASKSSTKSATVAHSSKHGSHKKASRTRGQQKIDSERARSIQQALIREHYLSGEPTGTWNQESEEAMRRYQGNHGWQTKEVPDSRALIKLGLGPSHDHLLNPESAMTTAPDAPRSATPAPISNPPTPAVPASAQPPAQSDPPSPQ